MYKPIPNWEGTYEISKHGEVRRVGKYSSGKPLRHWFRNGYPAVTLYCGGKGTNYQVHQLVLCAWVRLPNTDEEARHLDNDKLNCSLSNLKWGTSRQNSADMMKANRHGRVRACENSIGEKFSSVASAAKSYGVAYSALRLACCGRSKSCGLTWRFCNG